MERIPYEEVTFHPHSFGDSDGRLFSWRGELYRGIKSESADFFKRLFDHGVIEKLTAEKLLIESETTGLTLEGYAMVIRHRCVPFVSYPQEWCAAMFKDAALAYLQLAERLRSQGLRLKDTHPWNLLFDGCNPVYVDFTSISQITDSERYISADKFRRYYVYPLLLMAHGQERITRHLLPDYEGISSSELSLLMGQANPTLRAVVKHGIKRAVPETYREGFKRLLGSLGLLYSRKPGQRSQIDCLSTLREELQSIRLPAADDDPSQGDSLSSCRDGNATPLERLEKIIADCQPGSILTIDARRRVSSGLATLAQGTVVAFGKNSGPVTGLYCDGRDKNLPLLPLVMDFIDPTPSRGLQSHLCIAAAERLKCDMVLAFGLMDRMMERSLRFDQIVDGLAQFAKRQLVVDFLPPKGDPKLEACSGYQNENFINALGKKFRKISRCSGHAEGAALLLCEN